MTYSEVKLFDHTTAPRISGKRIVAGPGVRIEDHPLGSGVMVIREGQPPLLFAWPRVDYAVPEPEAPAPERPAKKQARKTTQRPAVKEQPVEAKAPPAGDPPGARQAGGPASSRS